MEGGDKEIGSAEERKKVAAQVREIRKIESGTGEGITYIDHNTLSDYLIKLGGLSNFMEHIRSISSDGTVLDIGAGVTHAISDLEKSKMAGDLKFQATVLSRQELIEKYLGYDKTKITPAETLSGIDDESIVGVIAMSSVAYSDSPRMSTNSIDRVLVPGGVFKGSFSSKPKKTGKIERGKVREYSGDSREFEKYFKELGYDIAVGSQYYSLSLLVAIKPGGEAEISAQKLLESDSGEKDQLRERHGEF